MRFGAMTMSQIERASGSGDMRAVHTELVFVRLRGGGLAGRRRPERKATVAAAADRK